MQLQQYDDALEDVNAALSTGFLQKGHTKNSLSKAYSIKGKFPNVHPKATFNKKIKSTYTIKIINLISYIYFLQPMHITIWASSKSHLCFSTELFTSVKLEAKERKLGIKELQSISVI